MISETRLIMGMPIILMSPNVPHGAPVFEKVFQFFRQVDARYSPFLDGSDVMNINVHTLLEVNYSPELREILAYAEQTKRETGGYFDVWHGTHFDPSGIVKGWAIQKAGEIMAQDVSDFYIEAGGDIQVCGQNDQHRPWRIGVRNPFDRSENIALVELNNHAIATSGTAIKGNHIYNPLSRRPIENVVSLSVIAPTILDADRMATAAFAMGEQGIQFIETLPGYEGYMVGTNRRATMTTGWHSLAVAA